MTEDATTLATWDELAVALGISTRQLGYDRKAPGAPRTKSLDTWRLWRGRKRPGTLPADSDAANDTLGERRLREEIRGMQLANDAREKRHQIEANRIAEEVVDRMVAKIRSALLGTFPAKLIEAVQGKAIDQGEAVIRGQIEELLRGLR